MKSFAKAIEVVDFVGRRPDVRFNDIVAGVDLPPTTVHRLLAELTSFGFLHRDTLSKVYRLGVRFLSYAALAAEQNDIKKVARDVLDRINRETGETVHLAVVDGKRMIYLDKRESVHAIRMYSAIGHPLPLHATGAGKAFLSRLNGSERERLVGPGPLERFTDRTVVDPVELNKELNESVSRGYALDTEEHERGIICLGAPLRDSHGAAVGAVSLTTLVSRMSLDALITHHRLVVDGAMEISKNLGYRPEATAALPLE